MYEFHGRRSIDTGIVRLPTYRARRSVDGTGRLTQHSVDDTGRLTQHSVGYFWSLAA